MTNDINSERNPYINTKGQRCLHKSITAFIDILGFRNLVKNAKEENKSQNLFLDFHQVISTWNNHIENLEKILPSPKNYKDRYIIRIFTDCILIGCPVREQKPNSNTIEGCDEFDDVLSLLSLFQLEMINKGYFVRGAIAVDELYMDDIIIYGNSVIEAYEAETKKAKYPRIVLTKSAEMMLMEINKGFVDKNYGNYLSKFFYRDSDGQIFINYLESIKIGEDNHQFVDELEKHKNMIESKLIEYRSDSHYLEKYVWSANYHNIFCIDDFEDYRINLSQYQMQTFAEFHLI
jgi:hypothetical protein